MPSGRAHDRITIWTVPWIAGGAFLATRSPLHILLTTIGYLLGGLLLSPDLDIHSRPYKRWGPFRWIWLPYRHAMRHRSMLSHGPIIGTVFRLAYLGTWLLLFWVIWVIAIAQLLDPQNWWNLSVNQIDHTLKVLRQTAYNHPTAAIAIFLGLELGGMSHALSDWGSSAWKRFQKRRIRAKAKQSRRRKSKLR